MRFSKRAMILAAGMMMVLTVTVLGSVAYLMDSASVTNTFTVGKVGIELDETKVDADGKPIDPDKDDDGNVDDDVTVADGETAVDNDNDGKPDEIRTPNGNEYHLLPGKEYTKNPRVTVNAGSEESYVRMTVKLNKYTELKEILGTDFLPENYVTGWNRDVWMVQDNPAVDETADTITYEFRYKETVKPSAAENTVLDALFETIKVPSTLSGDDLAKLQDFKIVVEGHAIQASGFTDANVAWAAFEGQMGTSTTSVNQTVDNGGAGIQSVNLDDQNNLYY